MLILILSLIAILLFFLALKGLRKPKKANDSAENFGKVSQASREEALAYKNNGDAKLASEDLKGAISDYNRAIELDPEFAEAYYARGDGFEKLAGLEGLYPRDNSAAIADYDKAIRFKPNFVEVYVKRGTAKSMSRDFQGAISDYSRAISIDPALAIAYNNRAIAKSTQGDQSGAVADLRTAAKLAEEQGDTQLYEQCISTLAYLQQ